LFVEGFLGIMSCKRVVKRIRCICVVRPFHDVWRLLLKDHTLSELDRIRVKSQMHCWWLPDHTPSWYILLRVEYFCLCKLGFRSKTLRQ
jgi:hypothetical protein